MDIAKFFKRRKEKILTTNPQFGFINDGLMNIRYITTDKGDYKENSLGEIFKFNKGVIEEDSERWEKLNG